MSAPSFAVLRGSRSDLPVIEKTLDILKSLEEPFAVKTSFAHHISMTAHACLKDANRKLLEQL